MPCTEKQLATARRYREGHRAEINAKARKRNHSEKYKLYVKANHDKIIATKKRSREKLRDKRNAAARDRYLLNRKAIIKWHRKYRVEHYQKRLETERRSRAKHKESQTAARRRYQASHKAELLEKYKAYVRDNPEKRSATLKKYWKSHPEVKAAIAARRRANLLRSSGNHTGEDILALFKLQGGKCATCRQVITNKSGPRHYHVDHVLSLVDGGSNSPDNLQLLCPKCNTKKNRKSPEQWAKENGLLFC